MKNKMDTKRALIDAAKALMLERGDFTVKDISALAFTNIAAINYHFGDKGRLVSEALGEIIEEFQAELLDAFDRDFESDQDALETVLNVLPEVYSHYRGAVKYILFADDPVLESGMADKFFFDSSFAGKFISRMPSADIVADPKELFYKYAISISAFLFPLLLEGMNTSAGYMLSLTALKNEDNRRAFIKTIMMLYK